METTLAGADGKSAAIDQATGQPLTIEDLLRRRGLLAVNGATRLNGQAPAVPVASNAGGAVVEGSPTDNRADVSTGEGAGDVDGLQQVLAARAQGNPAVAASTQAVPASVPAGNPLAVGGSGGSVSVDPNVLAPLGVGAAAGLGWALASRRKKSNGTGPAGLAGGGGTAPKPGKSPNEGGRGLPVLPGTSADGQRSNRRISSSNAVQPYAAPDPYYPYAEYTEVKNIDGPKTQIGHTPSTDRVAAGARSAVRASRGQPNDMGTIPMTNDATAGVSSELMAELAKRRKLLTDRTNGIARTLSRIVR